MVVREEGDIKNRRVAENQLINERCDSKFLNVCIFLASIFFGGSVPVFDKCTGLIETSPDLFFRVGAYGFNTNTIESKRND